jgi:hypothetical protein
LAFGFAFFPLARPQPVLGRSVNFNMKMSFQENEVSDGHSGRVYSINLFSVEA